MSNNRALEFYETAKEIVTPPEGKFPLAIWLATVRLRIESALMDAYQKGQEDEKASHPSKQ